MVEEAQNLRSRNDHARRARLAAQGTQAKAQAAGGDPNAVAASAAAAWVCLPTAWHQAAAAAAEVTGAATAKPGRLRALGAPQRLPEVAAARDPAASESSF